MKHRVFLHMSLIFNQKTLPLTQSAQSLFNYIADMPWAILLESASESHPDSRFDILSANPLVKLITKGHETKIETADKTVISHENPFQLIKRAQEEILGPLNSISSPLPFLGGALGYMSYDLGRWVEKIPEKASHDIDIPDMAVGIYDWAWILDRKTNEAHFVVLGDSHQFEARWQWWQTITQQQISDLKPFKLIEDWTSNLDKSAYQQCFNSIQDYLRAGDCYQINLTQRFSADYEGSEWQAYCALSSFNKAPFSAFIRLPDAAILSLSPERFLSLDGRHIETKPIKGTRPRSSDLIIDEENKKELQQSDKDRSENLMIVDLLRNDIGRVSQPGSVKVPKLFDIESFAAVHHMVSTITGMLNNQYEATDLLEACFPGGSITGAPKVRAMEIIEELEPHRRSVYCGSIFYISQHGRMDSSITIRTLIAWHQRLYVWAGGGIVADSNVDAEYQETFDKLGRILPILEQLAHGN